MESFSIREFCEQEKISRSMFYKLVKQGQAPETYNIGSNRRVSLESWKAWRAERKEGVAA